MALTIVAVNSIESLGAAIGVVSSDIRDIESVDPKHFKSQAELVTTSGDVYKFIVGLNCNVHFINSLSPVKIMILAEIERGF